MPIFDTPGPVSVNVELAVGDLLVAASDRVDTVVEVQPSDPTNPADVDAAERTRVEYADGLLRIKGHKGRKLASLRGSSGSIDVCIDVPTGSPVHADAGVATVRATGTLGAFRFKAGAGDVTIQEVAGPVELTTGMATVRIERIDGSTSIKNSNGDTWIGEATGDVRVKAANGKVTVDHARAAVTAKTANGDIRLGEVGCGVVVAETACGKVEVAVRSGVAAWLVLHTGLGHVQNLLEVGAQPGPSEATVEVRARSGFGDITIRRAPLAVNSQPAP